MDKAELTFSTYLFAFFKLLVMLAVALSLYMMVRHFYRLNLDVNDVESEIFISGLMNSPNGLSYTDSDTGRVYPGIIEYNGLNAEELELTFYYDENKYIAAKIELFGINGQAYKGSDSLYYNEQKFYIWYPWSKTGLTGKGSATMNTKDYPVIILDEGSKQSGILRITTLIPKS